MFEALEVCLITRKINDPLALGFAQCERLLN